MVEEPQKQIVIIAGPNGAGKTTFAREYLSQEAAGFEFLNADEIAAELCPEAPDSVAVRAGRMMLEQMSERVEDGTSFAVETTLSGKGYARMIPMWQSAGYEVQLHFLSLRAAEHSVHRVASRVARGGHHIPTKVIHRRFDTGLKNFYSLFRDLVDYWFLYDNSDLSPRLIDSGRKK